jgi:Transposase IS66 family
MGLWHRAKLGLISQKSKLANAIRYALPRWEGLTRFIDDVVRSIRLIVLNRKNALFAGPDGGAKHWATIAFSSRRANSTTSIRWLTPYMPNSMQGGRRRGRRASSARSVGGFSVAELFDARQRDDRECPSAPCRQPDAHPEAPSSKSLHDLQNTTEASASKPDRR